MSAATPQIAIIVAVLGYLVWLAMRRSKPRGARWPSGDSSWSGDALYNIVDSGHYHSVGGHDAGSGHSVSSGDSGSSDSGGGSDGGGSGSGD